MVRLEDALHPSQSSCCYDFNSSMVRLEAFSFCTQQTRLKISIPVWCDWKLFCRDAFSMFYQFQFQYGAIGSHRLTAPKTALRISIPVWCDWKVAVTYPSTACRSFQFQYG